MTTQLRWLPSFSASCLHAAEALRRGCPLADSALAEAIVQPVERLAESVSANGLNEDRFWRQLAALAAEIENNGQLAQRAATKSGGQLAATAVAELAGWIGDLEAAVRRAIPDLSEQLQLRGGPLRQQWEARGPGLLHRVAELGDPLLVVPNAKVILLHPALGGGGEPHLPYNSVRIEGMLANPLPELPEVLRLAWMLSQLNNDLPRFSESIHPDRLPYISALANLPLTLAAGESVELSRYSQEMITLALGSWRIGAPAEVELVADTLANWWTTYLDGQSSWTVALVALDHMLA